MDANAIQAVTKALSDLLTPVLGNLYVGPLDDDGAKDADAILFLYRVAINAALRNSEHRVPAPVSGDAPLVYEGGLPLDLYYLLTAGKSQSNGGELPLLRILGVAMQTLNGAPNLAGIPVQGETVRLTLDPISSEEMSRIWTLFPTANYRTSIVYLATPVWIDPAQPRTVGAPVTREPHRIGQFPVEPAA